MKGRADGGTAGGKGTETVKTKQTHKGEGGDQVEEQREMGWKACLTNEPKLILQSMGKH